MPANMIRISDEAHMRLRGLAESDNRSMTKQLDRIISEYPKSEHVLATIQAEYPELMAVDRGTQLLNRLKELLHG